jgi:hypothetical protein
MPAVTRWVRWGAAFFVTALLSRKSGAAPKRFELEPTLGYAATFTTGLSPYAAFVGLGLHTKLGASLWLSGSLFSYGGSSVAADGPGVSYRSRCRAYSAELDATWRVEWGRWLFEPGAELGAAWLLGATYVTPTRIEDGYLAANVGPLVRLGLRVGSVAWGVEGAALYVPSYAAAPVVRAGALALLPF